MDFLKRTRKWKIVDDEKLLKNYFQQLTERKIPLARKVTKEILAKKS